MTHEKMMVTYLTKEWKPMSEISDLDPKDEVLQCVELEDGSLMLFDGATIIKVNDQHSTTC